MQLGYQRNDGGRAAAGYRGETRDCVTRAIAIATGMPYADVYSAINTLATENGCGSSARTGVQRDTYRPYLESLGWRWVPTMAIGTGCRVHLRADELPAGTLIVKVSRHLTAVINGVIYDTYNPSRNGRRCVYGYYTR